MGSGKEEGLFLHFDWVEFLIVILGNYDHMGIYIVPFSNTLEHYTIKHNCLTLFGVLTVLCSANRQLLLSALYV